MLKYFDPRLNQFLFSHEIGPEMFATSWFLTLFSNKIGDIAIVYSLWEHVMVENDPLFILFLGMGFLASSKAELVS